MNPFKFERLLVAALLILGLSAVVHGEEPLELGKQGGIVFGVAFATDGKTLATTTPAYLRLWDVATGNELHKMRDPLGYFSVAFSPDGKLLATGSSRDEGGMVRLWETGNWREVAMLSDREHGFLGVSFSPDGLLLASTSDQREIKVWDVSGRKLRKFLSEGALATTFSPDGKTLAWWANQNLVLWDVKTETIRATVKAPDAISARPLSLAFSPDGKILALPAGDAEEGMVYLWDLANPKAPTVLKGHQSECQCVAFSPDSLLLASGGEDQTVRVWNIATKKQVGSFEKDKTYSLAFSPDGTLLASGHHAGFALLSRVSTLLDSNKARE